jgi:hypothetical protein
MFVKVTVQGIGRELVEGSQETGKALQTSIGAGSCRCDQFDPVASRNDQAFVQDFLINESGQRIG